YKWITWAMFMGPWSGARPPIREAIIKNVYISPGSGSLVAGKNTQSVVYYLKKIPEKDQNKNGWNMIFNFNP
ncbi:MAG: hypothetical protein WAK10_02455, partial [Methanoregula sp.]